MFFISGADDVPGSTFIFTPESGALLASAVFFEDIFVFLFKKCILLYIKLKNFTSNYLLVSMRTKFRQCSNNGTDIDERCEILRIRQFSSL